VAVQHQLRAVMAEASSRMREDLLKQFSSADAHNPLADFKAGTVSVIKRAAEQQDINLRALNEQIAGLKAEVVKLQAEREKADQVAAEHARSTAKGRPYEEAVVDALDEIATSRGDACDAVGDLPGAGGRRGDVVIGVEGCAGPSRARIVFEAKNSQVSKNRALAELDEAMASATPTTRSGWRPARTCCPGACSSCARSTGTSCSSPTTRRTARGCARGRLHARPRARADGEGRQRRARCRGLRRRSRRRSARWRTSGGSRPS
jgi:hypothetical protein